MRVIALIDDPHVVRRIVEHLGCWASERACRAGSGRAGLRVAGQRRPTPDITLCPTSRSAARSRRLASLGPRALRLRCAEEESGNLTQGALRIGRTDAQNASRRDNCKP